MLALQEPGTPPDSKTLSVPFRPRRRRDSDDGSPSLLARFKNRREKSEGYEMPLLRQVKWHLLDEYEASCANPVRNHRSFSSLMGSSDMTVFLSEASRSYAKQRLPNPHNVPPRFPSHAGRFLAWHAFLFIAASSQRASMPSQIYTNLLHAFTRQHSPGEKEATPLDKTDRVLSLYHGFRQPSSSRCSGPPSHGRRREVPCQSLNGSLRWRGRHLNALSLE